MRRLLRIAFVGVLAMPGAVGAVKPPPTSRETASCDVVLSVIDPDPNGTNVRAAPNLGGDILTVLALGDEAISAHVVAQRGDWMRIDRAEIADETQADGKRRMFEGDGWIHARLLGVPGLFVGGGTALRARADAESPVVFRLDHDDTQPTRLLGCSGRFVRVRYGETVGWTDRWCANERTTCN